VPRRSSTKAGPKARMGLRAESLRIDAAMLA